MKLRIPQDDSIEGNVARAVAAALAPALEDIAQRVANIPAPKVVHAGPPAEDSFVTVSKAAELLGTHKTTCLRYENEGRLPPRRMLGGRSGWLMSDLRALLQNLPNVPKLRPPQLDRAN
jgi:predicted DNA-binding transcriptional regulator AlpA